jgi:CPA1 family monovalent cation:H+ antiporter
VTTNLTDPISLLEAFVLLLAASVLVALVTRRTILPYSVGLVVLGLVVSLLDLPIQLTLGPEVLLAVLLPALVFDAAYRTDARLLFSTLPAVVLLAVPGVLLTAVAVGFALDAASPMPLGIAFLVGTMLAATDPAAVISVLSHLRAPARLTTLIEAESLFNDGTGIVIFAIALQALSAPVSPLGMVVDLVLVVTISIGIGAAIGWLASLALRPVPDHLLELTISLVAAYGSYLLAVRLGQSGLIATIVCALVIGNYARHAALSGRGRDAVDTVWEFIGFLATTVVFLLIGLSISLEQLRIAAVPIAVVLVALVVSRAVAVYGLLGGLGAATARFGWVTAVPLPWLHLINWSGLRGAVAVALALSLPADLPDRELVLGIVFGCVLLTLLIQGGTAQLLVNWLGLRRDEPEAEPG